ncbi:MAG: hypothetical protein WC188_09595 [Candidatus Caldatribacteriota bacterium]
MAEKGIFIAENMASTTVGSLLRSAVDTTKVRENGSIVALDGLVAGENNLYKAVDISAATDVIYFVDGVVLDPDEHVTKGLDDYVVPIGKEFRVRKPMVGDIFSISEKHINGLSKGDVVEMTDSGLAKKTTGTTNTSFTAKVIDKWVFGARAISMIRLEVITVA